MTRRLFATLLCLVRVSWAVAAPALAKAPKPLIAQVQRLAELLRDSQAVWYPATMVQFVKFREGEEIVFGRVHC
jgi:hypothetical protein